jgi:hypothetical protein
MFSPSEFFLFLRKPQYPGIEREETHIFGTVVKIYFAMLLFVGLFGTINIFILKAFITLPVDDSMEIPIYLKDKIWLYFSMVGMIVPVLEEIIFRLALLFNPINLSLSLSTIIALQSHRIFNYLITVVIFIILFLLIHRLVSAYKQNLISFWNKNFIYVFYSMCILFGLGHMGNYRYTNDIQYLIAPLLVLPQFIIGLVLAFTRLYYQKGFLMSILIHVMMNSITVSIYLLGSEH